MDKDSRLYSECKAYWGLTNSLVWVEFLKPRLHEMAEAPIPIPEKVDDIIRITEAHAKRAAARNLIYFIEGKAKQFQS